MWGAWGMWGENGRRQEQWRSRDGLRRHAVPRLCNHERPTYNSPGGNRITGGGRGVAKTQQRQRSGDHCERLATLSPCCLHAVSICVSAS
jgi:hypothetical protein